MVLGYFVLGIIFYLNLLENLGGWCCWGLGDGVVVVLQPGPEPGKGKVGQCTFAVKHCP